MEVFICDYSEIRDDNDFISSWIKLSDEQKCLYTMYGSFEWIDAISSVEKNIKICFCKDKFGNIVSICPFVVNSSSISLASCHPIGRVDGKLFSDICLKIFNMYKDKSIIYLKSVDVSSDFFRNIWIASKNSNNFFAYIEGFSRDLFVLDFYSTFENYMKKFNRKEKYNLKRQYNVANELSENDLKLVSVCSHGDVEYFMNSASDILSKSWKMNNTDEQVLFSDDSRGKHTSLAKAGLLRSYILLGKGDPWAFVLGYQWHGVYHYANISYKEKYSKYSPGTILLYMMLKDLFEQNKPNILNFGIGESNYKRRFSTSKRTDCSIFIVRKNILNMSKYGIMRIENHVKSFMKYVYHDLNLFGMRHRSRIHNK